MRRIFKKLFIVFFILFVLCLGSLWILLNSTQSTQKLVPFVVHHFFDQLQVKKILINKQNFDISGKWMFSGIQAEVVFEKQTYLLKAEEFSLKLSHLFDSKKKNIFVQLQKGGVFSPVINLEKVNIVLPIKFFKEGLAIVKGNASFEKSEMFGYVVEDFFTQIVYANFVAKFQDIKATFYGSNINAEISLDCQENLPYIASVSVGALDVEQLKKVNPSLVSNVKGVIGGKAKLSGTLKELVSIDGQVHILEKGQVKAALLKLFLDYIPQSVQKKQLQDLIKADGNVSLDQGTMTINTKDMQTLSTRYDLLSKKFNLDIHLTLDLNIEAGLLNLLKLQQSHF